MSRIPFFDIDDTLLKGDNLVHLKAFDEAIKSVFDIEVRTADKKWTGMVDGQIIRELLTTNGVEDKEIEAKIGMINRAMADCFSKNHLDFPITLMPGALELLKKLSDMRIPMGLLTGNAEPIAWTKLKDAGIDRYFSFGGFGGRATKRSELVPIAAENAGINLDKVVLIGDSPRDIGCAKEAGVKIIAVAAGKFGMLELQNYEPDLLVESLERDEEIINFLL